MPSKAKQIPYLPRADAWSFGLVLGGKHARGTSIARGPHPRDNLYSPSATIAEATVLTTTNTNTTSPPARASRDSIGSAFSEAPTLVEQDRTSAMADTGSGEMPPERRVSFGIGGAGNLRELDILSASIRL